MSFDPVTKRDADLVESRAEPVGAPAEAAQARREGAVRSLRCRSGHDQ